MIVWNSLQIERANMNNIKDPKLKEFVEAVLQQTSPLTQEQLDELKARPNYDTTGLVVAKSKRLFYLVYPPAVEFFDNPTNINLQVETIWDHQLSDFYSKYKLFGDPTGNIVRVTTDDTNYPKIEANV